MVMLGREVTLPVQLVFGGPPRTNNSASVNESEYVIGLKDRMDRAFAIVQENLRKVARRQKKDYDTRISMRMYDVGDLVYFLDSTRKIGKSPKLKSHKWRGPCVVLRRLSDLIYEIRAQQKGRAKILHHDRLKPFLSEEIPEWTRQLSLSLKKDKDQSPMKDSKPKSNSRLHSTVAQGACGPDKQGSVAEKSDVTLEESVGAGTPLRRSQRKKKPPDKLQVY